MIAFLVMYWGRMFFITAGYHRYFAHRSYKLGRGLQFVMAFGGGTAAQKGALWWAGHHRNHHRYSDTELDLHSPQKGLLVEPRGLDPLRQVRRRTRRHPGLRQVPRAALLDQARLDPPVDRRPRLLPRRRLERSGLRLLRSTVLLWHSTFFVNSLAHVMGRRRYATSDTSRNSAIIAFLPWARGGTTTTTTSRPRPARASTGGRSTRPSTCSRPSAGSASSGPQGAAGPGQAANRVADGNFDIGTYKAHWAQAQAALAHSHVDVEQPDAVVRAIEIEKLAVDDDLHRAMASAEQLARVTRRANKDLGHLDG